MNQSKFFTSTIVHSEKQLDRLMESSDFYDVLGIDESSALILRDSRVLNSKCIQSCSAFVYSASKLILWRTFLHLSSAFAGYDRRRTRLALTDTDSAIISTSRELHTYEKKQLAHIQKEANSDPTKTVLFDDTDIAMRSAKLYYKTFRRLMDASNLDEGNSNNDNNNKTYSFTQQCIGQPLNYLIFLKLFQKTPLLPARG